jgi:hypothetical protein
VIFNTITLIQPITLLLTINYLTLSLDIEELGTLEYRSFIVNNKELKDLYLELK